MRVKSTISLTQRLTSLRRLHKSLDEKIRQSQKHPFTNDLRLTELKKLKMKSKDEIAVLESILNNIGGKQPANAA